MNIVQGPFKLFQLKHGCFEISNYCFEIFKGLCTTKLYEFFGGMSYIHKCMHFHLITVIKSPTGA